MKHPILLIILFSLFLSTYSFSQIQFGIGGVAGFPTGEFGNVNNFGPGLYLDGKFAVNDRIAGGLGVSAIWFAGIDLGSTSAADPTVVIPILITADYIILDTKWTPYIGLGAGPYLIDSEIVNDTKVGVNPKVGILLGSLNLGVGYHLVSNFNFFSFQVGYLSR